MSHAKSRWAAFTATATRPPMTVPSARSRALTTTLVRGSHRRSPAPPPGCCVTGSGSNREPQIGQEPGRTRQSIYIAGRGGGGLTGGGSSRAEGWGGEDDDGVGAPLEALPLDSQRIPPFTPGPSRRHPHGDAHRHGVEHDGSGGTSGSVFCGSPRAGGKGRGAQTGAARLYLAGVCGALGDRLRLGAAGSADSARVPEWLQIEANLTPGSASRGWHQSTRPPRVTRPTRKTF